MARMKLSLALLLALAACSPADVSPADHEPPRRIVALTCNATDVLTVLGALDRVIAVEEDCPAPGTEDKIKIRNDDRAGKAKALNVEAILALRPDLVIAKSSLRELLAPLGVRVLWSPPALNLETMPDFVREVARVIGEAERGERVLACMRVKMDALRLATRGVQRVRVYYEGTGLGRSAGRRSVMHAMIELAGGRNVAEDVDRPGVVLTNEAILAADPEVIVLSPFADPTEEIVRRPGWENLSAVRSGRVHRIPLERRYVMLSTPRCVDGCEEFLLPWFHPDVVLPEEAR